ncbi:sulfur carrier protein ThiS [Alicyclobacillus tolerans]|uniref:sulfur carrier protein ThiS n=1 Tax=Alicyclobacillus tolerans TaxID=90970 RepID=UPI001F02096D|nr:sulfur carrier protein ThiS [Alicyclobacillus tolerans]MCF8564025.1 sulfur carrier protein ThiS [Alicyclobacillus tolerans]
MKIQLNGQPRQFDRSMTVIELLAQLDLTTERVAVECNGAIVDRGNFAVHRVNDNDVVEVVRFVGGG